MATHELVLALKEQIAQKHAEGIKLDEQLRQILLRKLEVTRETGILLDEAQENFGEQRWKEFTKSLPFDRDAIKTYLKFFRKHPEPIDDIATAMHCVTHASRQSLS